MSVRIEHGDCLEVMVRLHQEGVQVDSVVTDPPYHLTSIVKRFGKDNSAPAKSNGATGVYGRTAAGFMGQKWDGGDVAFRPETWRLAFDLLKPGGHMLVMGGTRTYHRMACAVEDAGFEIRDTIMWHHGQGFPKNHSVSGKLTVCKCTTNPVPYDHGEQTTEHDLRPLRQPDVSPPINAENERDEAVLAGLPQQDVSKRGATRPEPKAGDGEQSSMERREIHRASEGLCDGAQPSTSEGAKERLRSGAHLGGGEDVRAPADTGGRGSPHQSRPSGQQAGEFEGVPGPSNPLDGGTLLGCGRCPRCGNLKKEFVGFGTALKPATEIICLARKPLSEKTVAANVLKHGTGMLNIAACRVPSNGERTVRRNHGGTGNPENWRTGNGNDFTSGSERGRWPANVIHDGSEEVLQAFAKAGTRTSGTGAVKRATAAGHQGTVYGAESRPAGTPMIEYGDSGTAARFFYCAKADKGDRLQSKHPTVKPVDLMAYLCRLITPPGGTVLDPFAGSGTTAMAALREGFNAILIEKEARFVADIRRRLAHVEGADTPLFQGALP